jgi:type III pantothenate kinase
MVLKVFLVMLLSSLNLASALETSESPLLVVDVGNTRSKVALLQGEVILHQASFLTHNQEQYNQLIPWLRREFSALDRLSHIAVSSVVPHRNHFWYEVSTSLNCSLFLLSAETSSSLLTFTVDDPSQVGADRIAGLLGAKKLYPNQDLVIVDMGTAITLNFLTSSGFYLGGAIFSGFQTSIDHLTQTAALLSSTPIASIPLTVGKNTQDQLKLNLYFYHAGLKHLIPEMAYQAFGDHGLYKIIGTGGDAPLFASFNLFDVIEPDLKLIGIREAFIASQGAL